MAIDLRCLSRMHDFCLRTRAFGQVLCGAVDEKMLSKLIDTLNLPDVDGLGFTRKLLGFVCNKGVCETDPSASELEKKGITDVGISRLTDDELENFARDFIAHNTWLFLSYTDGDRQFSTNEKGERVVSYFPGKVELPHEEGESNSNYLVRVFRDYFRRRAQRETHRMGSLSSKHSVGRFAEEANRHLNQYSALSEMERMLRREEEIMQIIDPFRNMRGILEENSAFESVLKDLKRQEELMHSVTRQFERENQHIRELTQSSILAMGIYHNKDVISQIAREESQIKAMASSIAADITIHQQEARQLIEQHERMFRVPLPLEATRLLDDYHLGSVAKLVQQECAFMLDQQRLVEAIKTPWLHSVETARSVSAMIELQSIGNALTTMKGFDTRFTAALRKDLGDWRDKITFPETGLSDPVARTEFYIDRGFNQSLTDFPDTAFHQSLDLAGLGAESLDLALYGEVIPQSGNSEEVGLQRTNRCHDRLQRFERRLRQFIDKEMTAQYGPKWPRRLAPETFEKWEFKKQRAENESNGAIFSFIDFADFTDYETIICRQDHWREIFGKRLKRKESVRESLQRLQPIRIATMHSRIVTKEDELYLVAEILRLIGAIN